MLDNDSTLLSNSMVIKFLAEFKKFEPIANATLHVSYVMILILAQNVQRATEVRLVAGH
jgi:hypothetical protein